MAFYSMSRPPPVGDKRKANPDWIRLMNKQIKIVFLPQRIHSTTVSSWNLITFWNLCHPCRSIILFVLVDPFVCCLMPCYVPAGSSRLCASVIITPLENPLPPDDEWRMDAAYAADDGTDKQATEHTHYGSFLLFFAEEKSEDDLTACRICNSFKIRVFVTQLPSPHYTSTRVNNNEFCWLVACLLGLKLWASEIMNLILIPSINKPCRHRQ